MKIGQNSTVGAALRNARLASGMQLDDLAQPLRISVWALSRVESGKRAFDTDWIPLMPTSFRPIMKDVVTKQLFGAPTKVGFERRA